MQECVTAIAGLRGQMSTPCGTAAFTGRVVEEEETNR